MSFAGDLWSSTNRIPSVAKMNLKNVLVGTGDQILAKSAGSLQTGQIASVTTPSTGGALKIGVYTWNGSSWISPQGGLHTHQSSSDGGTFQNILFESIENLWFVNKMGVTKSEFKTSGTGGTYLDIITGTDTYVQINSGATSSNSGNLRYGGVLYTFQQPSEFAVKILLASTTTSSLARVGMNMELAEATTDNKVKYGMEGCGGGTGCSATNITIASANGTTRSRDSSSSDNYSTVGNFMMKADPGVNVKYIKGGGSVITKTTNPPASGTPDPANSWITGIQTSTAAARTLNLYGFYCVGSIGETWPSL